MTNKDKSSKGKQGPRKLRVLLPRYNTGNCEDMKAEASKTDLETAYEKNSSQVQCFINNKPKWNKDLGIFTLNFYDRITKLSVKNFQLVDRNDKDCAVLMQFGKVSDNSYHLDYQYPFSLFQAFAVALSSFDSKLFV